MAELANESPPPPSVLSIPVPVYWFVYIGKDIDKTNIVNYHYPSPFNWPQKAFTLVDPVLGIEDRQQVILLKT
jgi:hypothetical protein